MRRNFIIRKGFPFREEERRIFGLFLKKSKIFKETFGIPKVRNDDQKGAPHPFPPIGEEIGLRGTH
jgi:hypothetical protein